MRRYKETEQWSRADEDAITQAFISAVTGNVVADGLCFGLNGFKVRGRGHSAAGGGEKELGADGLGVVSVVTPDANVRAFFLFQAKKAEKISTRLDRSKAQCQVMLKHTAASQLMVLWGEGNVSFVGAAVASAANSPNPSLNELPYQSFVWLVCDELLYGLMLAPLEQELFRSDPDLFAQIKTILVISIRETNPLTLQDEIKEIIAEIGFDDIENILPLED